MWLQPSTPATLATPTAFDKRARPRIAFADRRAGTSLSVRALAATSCHSMLSNGEDAAAARCAASADEPEPEGRKGAPASKQPYPAFVMDVLLGDESCAAHELVGKMKSVMRDMLAQNVKGGTDSPLRLIVGFSTLPINEVLAPQLLKGPSCSQGRAPMELEVLEDPSCNLGLLDVASWREHGQSIRAESALAQSGAPAAVGWSPRPRSAVGTACAATVTNVLPPTAASAPPRPRSAIRSRHEEPSLPSIDDHQLSDLTTRIKPWVRLVFIYDNVGRAKSVVMRTLRKAQVEGWWQDALASVKPIPIPVILAQVVQTPERFTFVSWLGGINYGNTLQQYLMNLCKESKESESWRNPARLLLHGLDPLAPPSRTLEAESQKRTWDAASENPQHRRALCASIPGSGPSTSAPDTTENFAPGTSTANHAQFNWPPSPEANGLRRLLRGSALLLSEDQVAERANELLKIFATILEENWRLKCAAEAAAARDAEEQVRLNVRHTVLLALHPQ